MSILQQVMDEYGISELPESPTDRTDKRSNLPSGPTDRTDRSPFVGSVSESSAQSKYSKEEVEQPISRIDWGDNPVVRSVDKRSKELREHPDDLQREAGPDWDEVSNDPAQLVAFADSLAIVQIRESGRVPDHYRFITNCNNCGPVPVYEGLPQAVEACPWCMNGHTAPSMSGVTL